MRPVIAVAGESEHIINEDVRQVNKGGTGAHLGCLFEKMKNFWFFCIFLCFLCLHFRVNSYRLPCLHC